MHNNQLNSQTYGNGSFRTTICQKPAPNQTFQNQQNIIESNIKYQTLKRSLSSYDKNYIINMLIYEIKENQRIKNELIIAQNKISNFQQQQTQLQKSIKQKKQALQLITQNQLRNMTIIQCLQNELKQLKIKYEIQSSTQRQFDWKSKYEQLNKYMKEYMQNVKQVEGQFIKKYGLLKTENSRLLGKIEEVNNICKGQKVRNQQLWDEVNKNRMYISKLQKQMQNKEYVYNNVRGQNYTLMNKVKINEDRIQEQGKMVMKLSDEKVQLQRQISFIRQKFGENDKYMTQIIRKYQDLEYKVWNLQQQKQRFIEYGRRCQNKIYELQNNIIKQIQQRQNMSKKLIKTYQQNKVLTQDMFNIKSKYGQNNLKQYSALQQIKQLKIQYSIKQNQCKILQSQIQTLKNIIQNLNQNYQIQLQKTQLICNQLQQYFQHQPNKSPLLTPKTKSIQSIPN